MRSSRFHRCGSSRFARSRGVRNWELAVMVRSCSSQRLHLVCTEVIKFAFQQNATTSQNVGLFPSPSRVWNNNRESQIVGLRHNGLIPAIATTPAVSNYCNTMPPLLVLACVFVAVGLSAVCIRFQLQQLCRVAVHLAAAGLCCRMIGSAGARRLFWRFWSNLVSLIKRNAGMGTMVLR